MKHKDRCGTVSSQGSACQSSCVVVLELAFCHGRPYRFLKIEIGDLLGHLKILAGNIQTLVQEEILPMPVQASAGAGHRIGGQATDTKIMALFQIVRQPACLVYPGCQLLSLRVEDWKEVAPGRQEALPSSDRITCYRRILCGKPLPPVRQFKLLLLVGCVKSQKSFRKSGKL